MKSNPLILILIFLNDIKTSFDHEKAYCLANILKQDLFDTNLKNQE